MKTGIQTHLMSRFCFIIWESLRNGRTDLDQVFTGIGERRLFTRRECQYRYVS